MKRLSSLRNLTVPQLSELQSAAQPSPLTLLPSSHTSPPSSTPSPQKGTVQSVRQALGVG